MATGSYFGSYVPWSLSILHFGNAFFNSSNFAAMPVVFCQLDAPATAVRDQFQALPPSARPAAFLRAWTRKEAVLKAIGRGVQSLDCCDVTFGTDEPPALLELDGDRSAGRRWELFAWEPAAGYLAAGAVEVRGEE